MPGQRSAAAAASEPLPKQDSPVPTEMQGPPNYVSCFIGSLKSVFVPLVRGLQQLPPVLQAPILVALLLFSIIPVLWGLFVLPPALLIVAAVYSYNYGYQTFVRHFETAMREHFEISEESLKKVQENAGKIRSRAVNVKSQVSSKASNAFFLAIYAAIIYSMKLVEVLIQKLHALLNVLKSQGVKAKVNLPKDQPKEETAKPKKP